MKLTPRISQSPLIQYANFADGSHVNLIKLKKPYAWGGAYVVHETTKSVFCSSGIFKTYEEAIAKFNLMVESGSMMSSLVSQGSTSN